MAELAAIAASIGTVFGYSLLFGVSLPVIFALGVRSMAHGTGGDAELGEGREHPGSRVFAVLCFALVVLAIGYGVFVIVAKGFGL